MARGRSHLFSIINHFFYFMFWVISSHQTCTEIAEEPKSDPHQEHGLPVGKREAISSKRHRRAG